MTEMHTNPFEGWTQWRVGDHWSRTTPGGQKVTLSTWHCGGESGYSLTVDFDRVQYNSLGEVLAAYDALVAAEEWYAQVMRAVVAEQATVNATGEE